MLTAQVPPGTKLSKIHREIIELCNVSRSLSEILSAFGVSNRGYFKKHYLDLLIQCGIVTVTNPEKLRASNLRNVITDAGAQLKARRKFRDNYRNEEQNDWNR